MAKQTKITKSARNQECQIRIPGYCNGNSETVVLCHLGGAGMGRKGSDIHAAYGCSSCHDVVDHRDSCAFTDELIKVWFHEGIFRTQQILLDNGLIKI